MSESPHHREQREESPKRGASNGERERHSSRGRSRSPRRSHSPSQRSHSRDEKRNSPDKRDKDPESFTQVYVAKLHRRTREDDLKEAFSAFGKIKGIILKHTYAFIDFEEHEAAEKAIKEMNRKTFVNGEELVVEQSGNKN